MARVLLRAYEVYVERNKERKGVWRRSGLKGQVQNLFAKGERAFREAFAGAIPNDDNFIDAIVYAAFALVLKKEDAQERTINGSGIGLPNLLNGDWPWEG